MAVTDPPCRRAARSRRSRPGRVDMGWRNRPDVALSASLQPRRRSLHRRCSVSFLSLPRLNDRQSGDMLGYSEQANHLRLEFPEGEVDFLAVAPVFPDLKPIHAQVDGVDGAVRLMTDEEIIGQRLFYRAATFTGRDLYDFAAVTSSRPALLKDEALRKVVSARRDALVAALSSPNCERGYKEIDRPSLSISFVVARDALLDWIGRGGAGGDPRSG
jgi:hypothetical protein